MVLGAKAYSRFPLTLQGNSKLYYEGELPAGGQSQRKVWSMVRVPAYVSQGLPVTL